MSTVDRSSTLDELETQFPGAVIHRQETCDGTLTVWVPPEEAPGVLRYLKDEAVDPFPMLFDLTAIDERARKNRNGQPSSDFTLVYQILSFEAAVEK